jgi:putative oxidoreductase
LYGWGITVLRVVLCLLFVIHGAQKLFVFGFLGVAGSFDKIGIPDPTLAAVVVTLVELLGGMLLIIGLVRRLAALLLALDMLVATLLVHLPNDFFINNGWFEYTLILFAANVSPVLAGLGGAALDRVLAARSSPGLARLLRLTRRGLVLALLGAPRVVFERSC